MRKKSTEYNAIFEVTERRVSENSSVELDKNVAKHKIIYYEFQGTGTHWPYMRYCQWGIAHLSSDDGTSISLS